MDIFGWGCGVVNLMPLAYTNPGMGGTPYNGLYGEAPSERGIFIMSQVYKRVGIS